MQDLYTKNYKMPVKEIKKDLNKWRVILCSRIKDSTSLSIPHKLVHKFNANLIKIPAEYFVDADKLIFEFRKKSKDTRIN